MMYGLKMNSLRLAWALLICVKLFSVAAYADSNAEAILQAARVNPLGQPIVLNAQLRAGTQKVPFQIAVRDSLISYIFQNPEQEIILGLGEKSSTLDERRGGKTGAIAPARFDDSVRGGLLSYEDLALRFLYWKNPQLLDEETIRSRPAYKIEIPAPSTSTQYGAVRVWIDRQSGALLRIEGYDQDGHVSKRFEVVSVQKIGDQWMLKQMRVERIDPKTKKITGLTYLDVLGAAE